MLKKVLLIGCPLVYGLVLMETLMATQTQAAPVGEIIVEDQSKNLDQNLNQSQTTDQSLNPNLNQEQDQNLNQSSNQDSGEAVKDEQLKNNDQFNPLTPVVYTVRSFQPKTLRNNQHVLTQPDDTAKVEKKIQKSTEKQGGKKDGEKLPFVRSKVMQNIVARNIKEAIALAFDYSPLYVQLIIKTKISQIEKDKAVLGFLPSIVGKGTIGTENSRRVNDLDNKAHGSSRSSLAMQVGGNLISGKTTVNMLQAGQKLEAQQSIALKEEQELVLQIAKAWIETWLARQIYKLYVEKANNLKEEVAAKSISLQAGVSTRAELAQIESNYEKALHDSVKAKTDVATKEGEFAKITGVSITQEEIQLEGFPVEVQSLEEFKTRALRCSYLLNALLLQIKVAEQEHKKALLKLTPSVDYSLSARKSFSNRKHEKIRENDCSVEIGLTVPIFQVDEEGNTGYSAMAIANQKIKEAEAEYRSKYYSIEQECVISFSSHQMLESMIQSANAAVKSAEITSESNKQERDLGVKSVTEVLDAHNQLLDSNVSLVQAMANKALVEYQIAGLLCKLTKAQVYKKMNLG